MYRALDSVAFNDFVKVNELFDVKMMNSEFTWCGSQGKQSKLDRVLLNWNWFNQEDWVVQVLDRKNSDHRAILLSVVRRD